MEKLLLDALTANGWIRKAENWFVVSFHRVDFKYRIVCQNENGYVEDFEITIDDLFSFLYSNASGDRPAERNKMKDNEIIEKTAKLWVELGGDADGITWNWQELRDAVDIIISEPSRQLDRKAQP